MINLIFAMDPNYLIGKGNDLPWHYREDLQYFKETTLHKTVLMGRGTFESILARNHKPLPNRQSVVVTHREFTYPGVEVTHDLIGYLKAHREEELFVIGGKTVFEQAFPYADRLYVTYIKKTYSGDVHLEQFDLSDFSLIRKDEREELTFAVYERKTSS